MSVAERVRVHDVKLLSDNWYVLKKTTSNTCAATAGGRRSSAKPTTAATARPCCSSTCARRTVVLTRQFRFPAYVNGHDDLMVEVRRPARRATPEACIRPEAEQEAGYRIRAPRKVFEAYMSPGAVTEKLHFFAAEYDASDRVGGGGGLQRGRGHRGHRAALRRGAGDGRARRDPGCQDDHAVAVRGAEPVRARGLTPAE